MISFDLCLCCNKKYILPFFFFLQFQQNFILLKLFFLFIIKDPFKKSSNQMFNFIGNRCYRLELNDKRKFPNELFHIENGSSNQPASYARMGSQGFHCSAKDCYLEVNLSKNIFILHKKSYFFFFHKNSSIKEKLYFICGIIFKADYYLVKGFSIKYKYFDEKFEYLTTNGEIFV